MSNVIETKNIESKRERMNENRLLISLEKKQTLSNIIHLIEIKYTQNLDKN